MMVYITLHRFPQRSVGTVRFLYIYISAARNPMVPPMGPGISAGAMFALSLRKIINKLIVPNVTILLHSGKPTRDADHSRRVRAENHGSSMDFHGFSTSTNVYMSVFQCELFRRIPMDQWTNRSRCFDTWTRSGISTSRAILVLL